MDNSESGTWSFFRLCAASPAGAGSSGLLSEGPDRADSDDTSFGSDRERDVRPKYSVFAKSRKSVTRLRATRSDRRYVSMVNGKIR